MSIYCSSFILDEDHPPSCAQMVQVTDRGPGVHEFFTDAGGPFFYRQDLSRACTCDSHRAPLVYHGSHINPDGDGQRGGEVQLAFIPDHCHPDVRGLGPEAAEEHGKPVDFLRLSVDEHEDTWHGHNPGQAEVVLDRSQAEAMRDWLTEWLETEGRG